MDEFGISHVQFDVDAIGGKRVRFGAQLRPCLVCEAPLVIANGKIQGAAIFKREFGEPSTITPHMEGCSNLLSFPETR